MVKLVTIAKAFLALESKIYSLSRLFNGIAMSVLMFIMFLIVADVFGRYALNKPIKGSMEIVSFVLVLVVFFAMANMAAKKGNISVTLLIERLPPRCQAIFNSITDCISLITVIIIIWASILIAQSLMDSGETTALLQVPLYPIPLMLSVGALLLLLVLIASIVHYLSEATTK